MGRPSDSPLALDSALLLMDGDKVGRMLRQDQGERKVTEGLARFSARVDGIVREHGGNTVYAGGDDVLALLPLECALRAALKLHDSYRDAFDRVDGATISAAIVFAHFHVPLRHVLQEAHHRLDGVAKTENGRSSIAMCALTQSGITQEWVSTWDGDPVSPSQTMADAAHDIDAKTSGRFFHAVRAQYGDVIEGNVLGLDDIRAILLAEYRQGEAGAGQAPDATEKHMNQLFVLARRHAAPDRRPETEKGPLVSMDGPLMARFLARERRPA